MEVPKETPSWLLALGAEPTPETIELDGVLLRRERIFKHDFFAFTAVYRGDRGRVVLKIGRKASFFGLPLSWIGRLHAWHESAVLGEVGDLEIAPRFTGRYGKHGLTHEFIPGHQLARGEHVPDDFFDRLRSGVAEIHRRKLACVDLEKAENVLVGDDGRPYLFDFQIAFRWPFRRGGELFPFRWLRAKLQAGDRYHVTKLQRRCRPDQMTPEELAASQHRPLPVRLYTSATRPITRIRRRVLDRIVPVKARQPRAGPRQARVERGRVREPSRVE